MKAFALAVVATAGLLLSASPADAQYRSRGSYRTYSYPTYSYPTYGYSTSSYSTYSYPTVGTVVAPTYVDNGVVVTSGYTPTYSPAVYSSGYAPTYSPMVYPSGYSYPSSGFGSYYNSSSYYGSGYNGVYISPSGVNVGGRRIMRW